jgi:glycine hydroxymethyltransferase
MYQHVSEQDPDIYTALLGEDERQALSLEHIPSENYVSHAVRETLAGSFTNKYSEGYPGRRYYAGQEYTDVVERLAQHRIKTLFGAQFANVQPHSGSNANIAAFAALLSPGDTIVSMDLAHGGHLTHGHPVTHLAKTYRYVHYGMKDVSTGEIDYSALRTLVECEKPRLLLAGYSAYTRQLDYEQFVSIARDNDCYTMMDAAHIAGLIVAGLHVNPLTTGFDVVTATTHKTLRGPRGGVILTNNEELAKRIDKSVFPGLQGGPLMHHIAAKAVAFLEAQQPQFTSYAQRILDTAAVYADVFNEHGIRLIGGGTSNHMILADMTTLGISGGEAEKMLQAVGITTNKNVIPFDTGTAFDPSGLRLGTPALATRGISVETARDIAEMICAVLESNGDEQTMAQAREIVRAIAEQHPIPDAFV